VAQYAKFQQAYDNADYPIYSKCMTYRQQSGKHTSGRRDSGVEKRQSFAGK